MAREIMRWSPLRDMDRFFDEFPFQNWEGAGFSPALDIYQDKDNVIVEAQIGAIEPKDVEISVENDVLTIAGQREERKEIKREDYYRKEIREGSFSRSVILPMRVQGERAEASYEKGVLKIKLPKSEDVKPKKITIKAN